MARSGLDTPGTEEEHEEIHGPRRSGWEAEGERWARYDDGSRYHDFDDDSHR